MRWRGVARSVSVVVGATIGLGAAGAPVANAASTQQALFQDGGFLLRDPAAAFATLRQLGVDRVRLLMHWNEVAPNPNSRKRPAGFHAVSPAAYPKRAWSTWDTAITQAQINGIGIDLDLGGGAPLWATPPGAPKYSALSNWMPKASEFGAFVHAVGQRYSGDYDPKTGTLDPGNPDDLPKVTFWSVWNEPDYGPSLAPQGAPGNLKIERSPWTYRNLVDAAWTALHQTAHGSDTILFGEVAPRGYPTKQYPHLGWGIFSGMKPLTFLRALYCVDSHYRELRGVAAAERGCPTNAAGSRSFRARHPALFKASGFSDHMYSRWYPPNVERNNDPDYSSLADIGQLTRGLDRLNRVYGSSTKFPIWNTEYGYITSPPKRSPDPTNKVPYIKPATAAFFINWAEYISWRNPRILSTSQYLLTDPLPSLSTNDFGGFASGLIAYNGKPKATYNAYRLPIFLPNRTATSGQTLEVWGDARPSKYVMTTTGQVQTVEIQFAKGSTGNFQTVATVPVNNIRGYFDTQVVFPGSGTVRLKWSYPSVDTYSDPLPIYSRLVQINVH